MPRFTTCCALTLALSTSPAGAKPASNQLDMCGMTPSFTEDFSDFKVTSRDLGTNANWIAHTPWNGDFGDARFTDPGPGGPFATDHAMLHITARKTSGGWQSGLIAAGDGAGHGHGERYGYFEARMKLPPGPGTWPAFWLASLHRPGDRRPTIELDVIEYYGQSPATYHVTTHVWTHDKATEQHNGSTIVVRPQTLVTEFHNYGVKVTPQTIGYYLDGLLVWQGPTPRDHVFPLIPMVDLALGSGFSIAQTPNPSVLDVKYVHVYALRPGAHCD
ncbi:glycoside hydrolase family 16 protein [Novosphingobium sp.]|uniref:glycoside hydrolase family 16 protein n=1 Tax=Novosphingobium sp. TaxID=1874826 RepID=UPI003D0BC0C8